MVTNEPALIAGSMFALKNRIGAVDLIIAARLTANMTSVPTSTPSNVGV